jgi:hypothetical protein
VDLIFLSLPSSNFARFRRKINRLQKETDIKLCEIPLVPAVSYLQRTETSDDVDRRAKELEQKLIILHIMSWMILK